MAKRRQLNRVKVVKKAAAMADAEGSVSAVTLSALADTLNIRTPSLYNHIDNLDDLHHALAIYAMQQLIVGLRAAASGKVGREALLAMADAYRQFAHKHPGIYPLTIQAPEPHDEVLTALAQELLQLLQLVLASYGLQGNDALHVILGFRALLHGFAALETNAGFKLALDRDESFHRLVNTYLDGLVVEGGSL